MYNSVASVVNDSSCSPAANRAIVARAVADAGKLFPGKADGVAK
jgi:hypothetical protein